MEREYVNLCRLESGMICVFVEMTATPSIWQSGDPWADQDQRRRSGHRCGIAEVV